MRLFRIICKNDTPFLNTHVFFAEFADMTVFRRNVVIVRKQIAIFLNKPAQQQPQVSESAVGGLAAGGEALRMY